jgi:NACalpha-BTF3-like transcription factor
MTVESNNILSRYFLGKQFLEKHHLLDPLLSEINEQLRTITSENVFEWLSLNIYEDLLSIIESFINNELKNKFDLIDPGVSYEENKKLFNLIQFQVLNKCIQNSRYQIQSLIHQVKLKLMPFKIPSWQKFVHVVEKQMGMNIQALKTNYDIYLHQKQSEIIIFEDMITYENIANMHTAYNELFKKPANDILRCSQAVELINEFWKEELLKVISPYIIELYKAQNYKFQKVLNYFVDDIQKSVIQQTIKLKSKNYNNQVVRRKLLEFFKNEKYKNLIYTVIYQSIKNIYLSLKSNFMKKA